MRGCRGHNRSVPKNLTIAVLDYTFAGVYVTFDVLATADGHCRLLAWACAQLQLGVYPAVPQVQGSPLTRGNEQESCISLEKRLKALSVV